MQDSVANTSITPEQRHHWRNKLTELLDFHDDENGNTTWKCGDPDSGDRFFYAKQAAATIGGNADALIADAKSRHHVCCDCEILFNLHPSGEDEENSTASAEPVEIIPSRIVTRSLTGCAVQFTGVNSDAVASLLRTPPAVPLTVTDGRGELFLRDDAAQSITVVKSSWWVIRWDNGISVTVMTDGSFQHQVMIIPSDEVDT